MMCDDNDEIISVKLIWIDLTYHLYEEHNYDCCPNVNFKVDV